MGRAASGKGAEAGQPVVVERLGPEHFSTAGFLWNACGIIWIEFDLHMIISYHVHFLSWKPNLLKGISSFR